MADADGDSPRSTAPPASPSSSNYSSEKRKRPWGLSYDDDSLDDSATPRRKEGRGRLDAADDDNSRSTTINDTLGDDLKDDDEEARSACLALLSWHRHENGDSLLRRSVGNVLDTSTRLRDEVVDDNIEDIGTDESSEDGTCGAVSVLAQHLQRLGFRVGKSVAAPPDNRGAAGSVSVYRDSLVQSSAEAATTTRTESQQQQQGSCWELGGRDYWRVLLGVHPHQSVLERAYLHFRDAYCHLLLLKALRTRLMNDKKHHIVSPVMDDDAAGDNALLRHRQLETIDRLTAECVEGLLSGRPSNSLKVGGLERDERDAWWRTSNASNERRDCLYGHDAVTCHGEDSATDVVSWLHKHIFSGGTTTTATTTMFCTVEQVRAEHDRICARNSTLSNAYLQAWQRRQLDALRHQPSQRLPPDDLRLIRIEYHASPNPKYQRFKLFVSAARTCGTHSSQERPCQDANLILLPCLARLVNCGVHDVAQHLVQSFWDYLERACHYQSTFYLRSSISPSLAKFFESGLSTHTSPACIDVEAKFLPQYPFSLYLHGAPGTGKSSLVRHFGSALRHVLNEHVDPSLARLDTVKQMLNKPSSELELDLELRRNNNDMSLSSLLLSRRQWNHAPAAASNPTAGLVVLALEELAPPAKATTEGVGFAEEETGWVNSQHVSDPNQHSTLMDPNQQSTLMLLTQRLSGRSAAHSLESHVRSNGVARSGISGDPSILTIITSNYELTDASLALLRELHLFQNMTVIAMKAMEGEDRQDFAASYLDRCVRQQLRRRDPKSSSIQRYRINFRLPEGQRDGDVRPLVRMLRMIAYYVAAQVCMFSSSAKTSVHVLHTQSNRFALRLESEERKVTWKLRTGAASDLLMASMDPGVCCNTKTSQLAVSIRLVSSQYGIPCAELMTIAEFWLTGVLSPAVIVSTRENLVESILSIVLNVEEVHVLRHIDAGSYRMMRSLYDPIDTPNLRDDIRRLGTDKAVVVELVCPDVASQLCIREMIEDTPSMTAYSSSDSALHKDGLLFLVRVRGCEITSEIASRASLVL